MSSKSQTNSNSGSRSKNSSPKKDKKKKFDIKNMPFYNPELISKRKVIINTSTSKEMYSFPTTKRFTDFTKDNSHFFYNIPSSFSKRCTSFGYGNKNVFTDTARSPGPGTYGHIQTNDKGRYAVSEIPNTRLTKFSVAPRFKETPVGEQTPSPATYHPESMIKGDGIIYNSRYVSKLGKSFGKRLEKIGEKIVTPGPSDYKYMNLNLEGKYPSSMLSNSILNKFSKETRFNHMKDNGNPAPNAYRLESMIKGNGIVYNSRYNSNLGKSMSFRPNDLSKSATPGPGAHDFFSDFEGFYKYGKKKELSKSVREEPEETENKEGDSGDGNEGTENNASKDN